MSFGYAKRIYFAWWPAINKPVTIKTRWHRLQRHNVVPFQFLLSSPDSPPPPLQHLPAQTGLCWTEMCSVHQLPGLSTWTWWRFTSFLGFCDSGHSSKRKFAVVPISSPMNNRKQKRQRNVTVNKSNKSQIDCSTYVIPIRDSFNDICPFGPEKNFYCPNQRLLLFIFL